MPYIFVVDRDQPGLFEYMRDHFAEVPEIRVMLDRRRGDRRRKTVGRADRRRGDRRGVPADTWTTLGFVTVLPSADVTSERVFA